MCVKHSKSCVYSITNCVFEYIRCSAVLRVTRCQATSWKETAKYKLQSLKRSATARFLSLMEIYYLFTVLDFSRPHPRDPFHAWDVILRAPFQNLCFSLQNTRFSHKSLKPLLLIKLLDTLECHIAKTLRLIEFFDILDVLKVLERILGPQEQSSWIPGPSKCPTCPMFYIFCFLLDGSPKCPITL